MFERYTERARRVIFFARYEASQYGSRYIETEHLLLGIIRERHHTLHKLFPGQTNVESQIREEIERKSRRGERFPTSVEIPLTVECRKILQLAADVSDRLEHREINPEHLLIAILSMETCLATKILSARGLNVSRVEQHLEQERRAGSADVSVIRKRHEARADSSGQRIFNYF